MFDYTVNSKNSTTDFKKICNEIEHNLAPNYKGKLLIDVDGSTIQEYKKNDKSVVVYNDYEIGAVYVKSDMQLDFVKS